MRDRPPTRDHCCSNIALHFYIFVSLMKDHLSYNTTFCGPMGWFHIAGFIVQVSDYASITCQSSDGSLMNTSIVDSRRSLFFLSARSECIMTPSIKPFSLKGIIRLRIWRVILNGISSGIGKNWKVTFNWYQWTETQIWFSFCQYYMHFRSHPNMSTFPHTNKALIGVRRWMLVTLNM